MKLPGKNKRKHRENEDEQEGDVETGKPEKKTKRIKREKISEEPKDPTRWLPLLFLLVFLFLSYLFWV